MCGAGCDEMTQLAVQKALRPLVQMAASDSTRQGAVTPADPTRSMLLLVLHGAGVGRRHTRAGAPCGMSGRPMKKG